MNSLEEISLYVARRMQRGVFERFLNGAIEITGEPVDIDRCCLDRRGWKRFKACQDVMPVETVLGIARLKWKSAEDREKCIRDQKSKNKSRIDGESRWTDTLKLIQAFKSDDEIPLPALVHPDLHGQAGLRVIDGARRIVAQVEMNTEEFLVAVIRPKQNSALDKRL